nr:MAG TPA: capsid protein [Caudoviricetes sp.]DAY31849.1 MAG TPA: capsid protein [Caudoviricetes sp.]
MNINYKKYLKNKDRLGVKSIKTMREFEARIKSFKKG